MIGLFTERLLIRDYNIDDLKDYHEILSDNSVMYYLQDIKTNNFEESKDNFIKVLNDKDSNERKFYHFKIENKITKEFIGCIGYTVLNFASYGKSVHIGYFLKEKYWNNGYITEALKRLIQFAFEENDVYRLHTGCHKENIASEKIVVKHLHFV